MRWRRRQREVGRLPSLEQDYTEAHRRYVQRVGEGWELWLLETLRVIRRTLVPGGRIFIHEGVRPEPGSERERELFAEMEQSARWSRHSIPSSFVSVLEEAGFEQVTRFAAFDELIDVSAIEEERRVEVPRQALPQSLPAGRSADIEIHVPRASVHGASEIRIDAVREGIAWFAGYGSSPLAVQLPDNP